MSAAGGVLNDTDVDAGETLVVSAVGGNGENVGQNVTGSLGTLNLDADGSYTYIADQAGADAITAGQTATDTFTYALSDGEGNTSTVNLVITVTGKGPQGVADTATVTENSSVEKNNAATNGVLANDDDNASFDQESLAVTAITGASAGTVGGTTAGTHGTLTMNQDGTYSYAATNDALDDGETVNDVFTYTVKDDDDKNRAPQR